jgi:Flp pilus assembly protein protease CpaA
MMDMTVLYFLVICFLLIMIAVCDFLYYRIPNVFIFALLVLFLWVDPTILIKNYLWPCIILAIGLILSIFNIMGYGDSKLFATLLLGVGSSLGLHLLMYTVVLGGVFAAMHLFAGHVLQKIRLTILKNKTVRDGFSYVIEDSTTLYEEIKNGHYKDYLPYGVNIAVAGMICAFLYLFKQC